MTRTEETEWWTNAVYEAVQEIPRGKVTSYGHIARLLGQREDSAKFSFLCPLSYFLLLAPSYALAYIYVLQPTTAPFPCNKRNKKEELGRNARLKRKEKSWGKERSNQHMCLTWTNS